MHELISTPGLPPQVRGAPVETCPSGYSTLAYPRRCGEHAMTDPSESGLWGLPPQVRGAQRRAR